MFPYPPQPLGFPAGRRYTVMAALPLYVLVRQYPAGAGQVLCEPVMFGQASGSQAMVTYLSPFEASLDALWLGLTPQDYQVLPAAAFSPDELIARHHGYLPYCLHMAWGAHDGCLAVRAQGGPVRLSSTKVARVSERIDTITLDIGLADLECAARLWECAGLFARCETEARLLRLSPSERHRHAARAIDRVPATAASGQEINQLALYDADAAQWHFISLDLFFSVAARRR
ncbi:hypothetical protein HBDW_28420 [Herbaspirillum sp. DW155]|uniref:hypothetical protein n=1 Tax=Herbaspirillum sp. DW155 TaxID=3095609 RepID=UPI003089C164|nr:hypothetical protein HBDW_28420 [Herbaspirillum sp. DW155]